MLLPWNSKLYWASKNSQQFKNSMGTNFNDYELKTLQGHPNKFKNLHKLKKKQFNCHPLSLLIVLFTIQHLQQHKSK